MATERRAAKEAYLAALQQQVAVDVTTNYQNKSDDKSNVHIKVMSDRERMLNERQQQFLRNQDKSLSQQNNNSSQQQQQQSSTYDSHSGIDQTKWKEQGYPSEYAYMQDNGALDIKRNSTDKSKYNFSEGSKSNDPLSQQIDEKESINERDRNKDIHSNNNNNNNNYNSNSNKNHNNNNNNNNSNNNNDDNNGNKIEYKGVAVALRGLGDQSAINSSPERRLQQKQEYKRLLQSDQNKQQQLQHKYPREIDNINFTSPERIMKGGIASIGDHNDSNAEKKSKQAEYALYLENQMNARKLRNNDQIQNDMHSNISSKFGDVRLGGGGEGGGEGNLGGGIPNIGVGNNKTKLDEKAAKREKQMEYARGLKEQQEFVHQKSLNQREQQQQQQQEQWQQQQKQQQQQQQRNDRDRDKDRDMTRFDPSPHRIVQNINPHNPYDSRMPIDAGRNRSERDELSSNQVANYDYDKRLGHQQGRGQGQVNMELSPREEQIKMAICLLVWKFLPSYILFYLNPSLLSLALLPFFYYLYFLLPFFPNYLPSFLSLLPSLLS